MRFKFIMLTFVLAYGHISYVLLYRYFISPEVIRGEAKTALLLQKSDVWSIGCTVYQMACGKPPWQDQLGTAPFYYLVGRISPEDEVPLKCESMDEAVVEFIQAAMHADPVQRPTPKALLAHQFVNRIPEPSSTDFSPLQSRRALTSTDFSPLQSRRSSSSPATPLQSRRSSSSPATPLQPGRSSSSSPATPKPRPSPEVQPNNIGFCEGFGPSNSDVGGAEDAVRLTLSAFSSTASGHKSRSPLPPTPLNSGKIPLQSTAMPGAGADDSTLRTVSPTTAAGGNVVVFTTGSVDGDDAGTTTEV